MGFYNGTAMELLCQQVVRDNPAMAGKITPDTVAVNGSAVARTANGRNSQITFVGIPGKGFLGELTLSYDRINLQTFTGTLYLPVEVSAGVTTYADALPDINEQLGLNLTRADLNAPDTVLTGGITFTSLSLAIAATSPLYTSSLRISWRRAAVGVYPDSGPGTQELRVGDEQLGYFGVVSGGLMPTSQQVVNGALSGSGITPPTIAAPTAPDWLKFFYKGKVLFIPKTNMTGTTWDNYYKAGSAYGTGDPNAVLNPSTDKVVTEQDKIFSFVQNNKGYYFHHRLPRGSETLYQNPGSGSVTLGEDYALVSKLNGGEWGTESGIALFGNYWMSQHRIAGDNNAGYFCIFNFLGQGFAGQTLKSTAYNYVPILELINPNDVLLPIADMDARLAVVASPATVMIEPMVTELAPISLTEVATLSLTPATAVARNEDSLTPLAPEEESYTLRLTPVVATTTVKVPASKTDLAVTNGTLGGFE
jgi:hypothetical protein